MEDLLLGYILGCLLNDDGRALLKAFDYAINPGKGLLLRFKGSGETYVILVNGFGPMEATAFERLKNSSA